MKIVTVIGARPQFIKSALVGKAIDRYNNVGKTPKIEELILHTGQHYDANMNDVFFSALNVRKPHWQLHCGGKNNVALMLSEMIAEISDALIESNPDFLLVYGDTTSTLAGALAGSAHHIPVIHIEAGLRSFNRNMPEEINRILTDHIATLLFCPTKKSVTNLANENIINNVFHTGDVMYDAALAYAQVAADKSQILENLHIKPKKYRLCTVHRAENTDNQENLTKIVNALLHLATVDLPVILPIHPRTAFCLKKYNLETLIASNNSLIVTDPVDYIDMTMLEMNALTILTDSGGMQKEAYFHRTPCITLRCETEWTETVGAGWNQIAGFETENILKCVENSGEGVAEIDEYGKGNASDLIVEKIADHFKNFRKR